jgi:hypothetical protein
VAADRRRAGTIVGVVAAPILLAFASAFSPPHLGQEIGGAAPTWTAAVCMLGAARIRRSRHGRSESVRLVAVVVVVPVVLVVLVLPSTWC